MTRGEALYKVKGYLTDIIPAENYSEVEEIIKALEQEPCEDYISRQSALDVLQCEWCIEKISNLPSADRPTGYWVLANEQRKEDTENDNYRYICSNCNHSDIHSKSQEVPFCWYCGAKMRGNKE